jgi:hypothetical protein
LVDAGPVFEQIDGDGIGLLARGGRHRPDADGRESALFPGNFAKHGGDQALELIFLPKKIGFVDRHQIGQVCNSSPEASKRSIMK